MGNLNLLSMKGGIIGIFITLILILAIPLLFLLLQQRQAMSTKVVEPTPAPVTVSTVTSSGQGSLAGYIYHDNNANGQREEEEKPFDNVKIQLRILRENGDNTKSLMDTITDSYGYFSFRFTSEQTSNYMLKVVVPANYKAVNANPLIISDLKPNSQKIVEFGLVTFGDALISPTDKSNLKKLTPTP